MRYFKQVMQGNTIYWELMGEGKDWQLNLKRTVETVFGTNLLEKYLGMVKYLVNSKVVELPEGKGGNLMYEEVDDEVRMYSERVKMNYIPVGEIVVCESTFEKREKVFELYCNFIYIDIRYLRSVVDEYYYRNEDGESCDEVYSTVNMGECSEVKDCGVIYKSGEVEFKVAPDNSFVIINIDGEFYIIDGKEGVLLNHDSKLVDVLDSGDSIYCESVDIKKFKLELRKSLYFIRESVSYGEVRYIFDGVKDDEFFKNKEA